MWHDQEEKEVCCSVGDVPPHSNAMASNERIQWIVKLVQNKQIQMNIENAMEKKDLQD